MVKRKRRRFKFTKADHERVRRAVHAAESATTGELVPWVVHSCKAYRWVHGMLMFVGMAVGTVALVVRHREDPAEVDLFTTLLWQSAGAVAGLAVSMVPAVRRLLIPASWLAAEVHERALSGFMAAGLPEVRERNGVLIFVSLFEQRVQILADKGIHALAPAGYWDERVKQIVAGVHHGRPIDALCESIAEIGKLLSEKFPSGGKPHENQLPDRLRED